jgi:hypothetical protein
MLRGVRSLLTQAPPPSAAQLNYIANEPLERGLPVIVSNPATMFMSQMAYTTLLVFNRRRDDPGMRLLRLAVTKPPAWLRIRT